MKNFTRRNSFKKLSLSRIFVTLAIALFFGLSTYAYDFEVNGIYYNITSDKEVEVTTPENPDEYSGSIIIPETVTFDGIKYSVTAIGNWAFSYCYDLMNIDIPNSVTSIGSNAFTDTGWFNNQSDGILYLNNCCLGYKGNEPQGNLTIKKILG